MENTSVNKAFITATKRSVYNPNANKKALAKASLESILNSAYADKPYSKVIGAVVINKEIENPNGDNWHFKKIQLLLEGGDPIELPLDSKSLLQEGEAVEVESIFGTLYSKQGKDDFVEFDGEVDEE